MSGHERLNSHRRRANLLSWLMLILGLALPAVGIWLSLGNGFVEWEKGASGLEIKAIRVPLPLFFWILPASFCYSQYKEERKRAKELEDRQFRQDHIQYPLAHKMTAEEEIRLVEIGPDHSVPQQKPKPQSRPWYRRAFPGEKELRGVKLAFKDLPAPTESEASTAKHPSSPAVASREPASNTASGSS